MVESTEKRIREGEEQREPDADHRHRVEQPGDHEHLDAQHRQQLGLTGRPFDEASAQYAETDGGAGGAQAEDDADRQNGHGLYLCDVHSTLLRRRNRYLNPKQQPGAAAALVMLAGQRQVNDRQYHEYERLQRDDQDVEHGPDHSQQDLAEDRQPAANAQQRVDPARQRQHRDQQEDHFPGVQIAVETQRQRYRPCQQRHRFQQEVHRYQQRLQEHVLGAEGMQRELADEADETLHLDAVEDDQREDAQGHREGGVEVGARHDLQVLKPRAARGGGQQVDRHEVHDVEQQDPAEDRQRQRRDELAAGMESILDLVVDEVDQHFDEQQELPRHSGRGATRRDVESTAEEHREQHREENGIEVDGGEVDDAVRHLVREKRLVMHDVVGRAATAFRRHHETRDQFAHNDSGICSDAARVRKTRQRTHECDPVHQQGRPKGGEHRQRRHLHHPQHQHEQCEHDAVSQPPRLGQIDRRHLI